MATRQIPTEVKVHLNIFSFGLTKHQLFNLHMSIDNELAMLGHTLVILVKQYKHTK